MIQYCKSTRMIFVITIRRQNFLIRNNGISFVIDFFKCARP